MRHTCKTCGSLAVFLTHATSHDALQVGLKVLSAANIIARLARCVYPFVPALDAKCMDEIEDVVNVLSKKSTVEDFACVQDAFDAEDNKPQKQVRGG